MERYGYTLMAVGETEEQAKDSIRKEYIREYKSRNIAMPYKEAVERLLEDINTYEMTLGKVEWK